MSNKRRIVRVGVSFPLLLNMVRTDFDTRGIVQCIRGVPPDAAYVSSYISQVEDCVYLVFYHPGFAEISEGEEIPRVNVVHQIKSVEEQYALTHTDGAQGIRVR